MDCKFPVKHFMYWTPNQLLPGHLGKTRKVRNKKLWVTVWKERQFPQPYARLAEQLTFEDIHGLADHGHESVRRQAYARRVLDEFGKEFEAYNGPPARFRSRVFTPILQRQLQGMPDAYAPALSRKLSLTKPCGPVSIREATAFYLGVDPLNHLCIGSFRRNLIYIREARWHLAVRLEKIDIASKSHFDWYLDNHEIILKGLQEDAEDRQSESESDAELEVEISHKLKKKTTIPLLSYKEIGVILTEDLEDFFADSLKRVVRTIP